MKFSRPASQPMEKVGLFDFRRWKIEPIPVLFQPYTLRSVTLRNRIGMSPMCQYSSYEGLLNSWHRVHLGSRAVGGAGLVFVEATSVEARGRISPSDSGIWNDAHVEALTPVARFIHEMGAVAGIQIGHAGRKASTHEPWNGNGRIAPEDGGWVTIAPSAVPFHESYPLPRAMNASDLDAVSAAFVAAAKRAYEAGFRWLELHMAHGYLLHEFLSPLSNLREDEWGGSLKNRMRFPLRIACEVRDVWPVHLPLAVRISTTDWVEGGWDIDQSVVFSKALKECGVDLIDCSSGGLHPNQKITAGPGYQVPFSERIRREAEIATAAVGLITEPEQANGIIQEGQADIVLLGRELLRNPYWPMTAAKTLGYDIPWPNQYLRARR